MRIRKNAKLSPLLFSSSSSCSQGGSFPVEAFQSHVCQLNQSPWDVIPFDSDSIQLQPQFEGDDSFTAGNGAGSAGDSVGAVESVASMMEADDSSLPKIEGMAMEDDNHDNNDEKTNGDKGVAKNSCCKSLDGKGWPCKNEAKPGQSFCSHHLSVLRSYNNNNNNNKKAAAAAGGRRARARGAGKKTPSSSSNPYEFYYYSGFGPLWGKRRGDRNGEGNSSIVPESDNNNNNINNVDAVVATPTPTPTPTPPSSSDAAVANNEEFDYVVDDDEEEDANDDTGKKRMRKPVKARSLKSLM